MLAGWLLLSLSFSSLAYQIFDPQVDAYEAVPSFRPQKGQLSSIDCLIGSLYYDDFTDERATPAKVRQLLAPYQAQPGTGLRPDVIVVMSESYFDLNRVQGLTVPPEIYQNFRRMQRQGSSGRIVVPRFWRRHSLDGIRGAERHFQHLFAGHPFPLRPRPGQPALAHFCGLLSGAGV